MRKRANRIMKCRLKGWSWGLPFVLAPAAVLFFEVWAHTEIRLNDYRVSELRAEHQRLTDRINALKAQQAELEALDRIHAKAPDLGLINPQPHQVELLYISQEEDTLRLELANLQDRPKP